MIPPIICSSVNAHNESAPSNEQNCAGGMRGVREGSAACGDKKVLEKASPAPIVDRIALLKEALRAVEWCEKHIIIIMQEEREKKRKSPGRKGRTQTKKTCRAFPPLPLFHSLLLVLPVVALLTGMGIVILAAIIPMIRISVVINSPPARCSTTPLLF